MALKIPECNARIRALWHAEQNTRPGISERKWALEHKIDATKFNYWLKDTQPDLSGLKQLEAVFRVNGFCLATKAWWPWSAIGSCGRTSRRPRPCPRSRSQLRAGSVDGLAESSLRTLALS